MADRSIHYEAAFEAYLRHRGIPYVAVDEAKRALFADAKLKSFDFVVYSKRGPNLLVDIKGRQCKSRGGAGSRGGGAGSGRASLQTWAAEQDIMDLSQWEQVFGDGFKAILIFMYWIDAPLTPEPGMFEHRDRWYLLMGVDLAEYRNAMRRRSSKWATVSLRSEDFRQLARPIESWLSWDAWQAPQSLPQSPASAPLSPRQPRRAPAAG
jgi:hypothetical protein